MSTRLRPVIQLSPATTPPLPTRKIPTAEVLTFLGITRASLERLRELPDFPRPFRYSENGRLVWDVAELEAWVASRRVADAS